MLNQLYHELKILVTQSKLLNLFVVLNATKILVIHCLLDSHKIDSFIVVIMAEYIISAFIYFFITAISGRRILFLLFYVLQVAYFSVTLSYNLIFSSNIHVNILSTLLWEFTAVASEVFSWQVLLALAIALIDVPLFVVAYKQFDDISGVIRGDVRLYRRHLAAGTVSLLCIVTSVNAFEFIHLGNNPERSALIEDYALHHYGMFASNYLEIYHYKNSKESIHKLNYGRQSNASVVSGTKKGPTRPSILLIQVESLDANIINKTWNGKYVAPYLHKLSQNSLYFPYTLSYHLAGGTSDTEMTILNNTEPLSDSPTIAIKNYSFPNALSRIFEQNKYRTMAFHGNVGEYYHRNEAYAEMGFDIFYDMTRMRLSQEGWGASDGKVFDFAINKLAGKKSPFFSYIITMSSHEPFKNVHNYYATSSFDSVEPEMLKDYLTSIEYVDKQLERFVEQVRKHNKNTYVIIFGDHTPYRLTKGPYHLASFELDKHKFEFVPLFIITPDNRAYQETARAVSFLDLAPTILQNSNADYSYNCVGENLFERFGAKMIPYKGNFYDRTRLYQLARDTDRVNFPGIVE